MCLRYLTGHAVNEEREMSRWFIGGFVLIAGILMVTMVAIELPCFMPSRISTNEVSAVTSIKKINAAEEQYRAIYGGYADSLTNLGGAEPCTRSAATACLLDERLASGTKSGYRFAVAAVKAVNGASAVFVVGAAPEQFARTGLRLFCSTNNDVIRVDRNEESSTTPPGFEQCVGFRPLQ
jgi:hypothetical protein